MIFKKLFDYFLFILTINTMKLDFILNLQTCPKIANLSLIYNY